MIVFVNHYEVEDREGHFVSFHQSQDDAIEKAVVLNDCYEPREGYVLTYRYDGETVTTIDLSTYIEDRCDELNAELEEEFKEDKREEEYLRWMTY